MTNADAARVLRVLDEMQAGVRLVASCTDEVLASAEQLEAVVGASLSAGLVQCREATMHGDAELCGEAALALLRAAAADTAGASALQQLDTTSSAGAQGLLATLALLQGTVRQRLSTTVEEENSTSEYFNEVQAREENAGKERHNLKQQLSSERRERARQAGSMAEAEARARAEFDGVETHAAMTDRALGSQKARQMEAEASSFAEEEKAMLQEREQLTLRLEEMQKNHRDVEAVLRKKKTKAEDEVANWLGEYDTDMGAKEKALTEERAVYEQVVKQLREYEEHYAKLRKEVEAREARELAEEMKRKKREAEERKRDAAAAAIQGAWRQHRDAKAPKKKGKGKKGKK